MYTQPVSISFWRRLLNISPKEGGRLVHGWLLRFFFQWGYVIGWTLITAMVVTHFGIQGLPFFYVLNGILMILGTYVFSHLITFCSRRFLVLTTAGGAAFLLSCALLLSESHPVLFITGLILVMSICSSQLHILLMAYVEELFTPLEFERLNPIVETAEPLGGIAAGLSFVFLVGMMRPEGFVYIWTLVLCALIPLYIGIRFRRYLPRVEIGEEQGGHGMKEFRIRAVPFVRLLVVVILLHWMYFNLLGYQYTSAVDMFIGHHSDGGHLELLAGERLLADASELTHGLGLLHLIFSCGMLLTQLFLSSRIVTRLGVVASMMVLPVITLLGSTGLLLHFGIVSAILAKGTYEAGLVIFNNGYHNSYYAFYERAREHIREFLEGGVRSLGTILGTLLLIGVQVWIPEHLAPQTLSLLMIVISICLLVLLWYMREQYTRVAAHGLDVPDGHPDKLHSIEVLTQRGHLDADEILGNVLIYRKEPRDVQVAVLRALGRIGSMTSLPDIVMMLKSEDTAVQIAAVQAIGSIRGLQEQDTVQTFAKHRVVHTLSDLFTQTTSEEVRLAIMDTFVRIKHPDVVDLLIHNIHTRTTDVRASVIAIIGRFGDPSSLFYLETYLRDRSPAVRAQVIIALWQFKKYRMKLLGPLLALLESTQKKAVLAGITAVGEIRAYQEKERLYRFLESEDADICLAALVALVRMDEEPAILPLVQWVVHQQPTTVQRLWKDIHRCSPAMKRRFHVVLVDALQPILRERYGDTRVLTLHNMTKKDIEELAYYYELLGESRELFKIRHALHNA